MEESVISTMDNTAFFDNVTWLNQQNWQNYFGKTLPNGVIVDGSLKLSETGYTLSGTMDITTDENNIIIGSGAVMANGLYAENLLPVQIPHVTQAEATKFICVRFSLESANAKIVCKTNVVPSGTSYTSVIRALNVDESYLCDRNPDVYEIPLAFEYYDGSTLDLRRLVYAPSSEKHYLDLTSGKANNSTAVPGVVRGKSHAQVFGGTTYFITIDSNDANSRFTLYPRFTNSTEPIIVCIQNNSGSTKDLTLSNSVNGFSISYEWIDSWQSSIYGKYTDFVTGSSKILILFPAKITTSGASFGVLTKGTSEGGSVDPDSVYTKQEINNLLASKANSADVNSALSTKEDITNLGALAYQNRVNYLTQIDNKPDENNIIDVTYYVSKINGSDGNLGTQESPFKTIQHAIDSVGINCIGTIIIASDTYVEKLEIKGKHIVLKQAELPEESTYEPFNTEILINPSSEYDEDYCIEVIDNGIAELIGFFTVKAYHYGILVSDNSCLFLDGKYYLNNATSGTGSDKYCSLKVDLAVSPTGNGTPFDEIITPWMGNGVHVRNASNFITKSYNKVIISNVVTQSGAPVTAGYGFRIENSYCFAYDADFDHLHTYVYCFGGIFRYRQSNKEGYDRFEGDGVIKSLDFGSLAYKDDVSNNDKYYLRRNKEWVELALPETEVPTLGTLAFKNTADYNTEIINKPSIYNKAQLDDKLNSIANENDLSYSFVTLYVSKSGTDHADNGTESNPYQTIQYAVSKVGNLQTKIVISQGTYDEDYGIEIDNKKITFECNNVTIRDTYGLETLHITNNSKVKITGKLSLYGDKSNVIKIENNSHLEYIPINSDDKLSCVSTNDLGSDTGVIYSTSVHGISIYDDSSFICNGELRIRQTHTNITNRLFCGVVTAENSKVYIKYLDHAYRGGYVFYNSDSEIIYSALHNEYSSYTDIVDPESTGVTESGDKIHVYYDTGVLRKPDKITQEYYVDGLHGDDTSKGNRTYPFKTIEKALNVSSGYGDTTIYLVGGDFVYNERIKIEKRNVVFSALDNYTVRITGTKPPSGYDDAIKISNNANVTLIGKFSIRGYYGCIGINNNSTLTVNGTLDVRPAPDPNNSHSYYNSFNYVTVRNNSSLYGTSINVIGDDSEGYTYANSTGICIQFNSTASIHNLTFYGNIDSAYNAKSIDVLAGILWYETITGSETFYKDMGGLILTGSNN